MQRSVVSVVILCHSLPSLFVLSFHFLLFFHSFSSGDSTQVHCVDLGESFPTSIYLQNLASIQPRTSLVKFAHSPCTESTTDPPGIATRTHTHIEILQVTLVSLSSKTLDFMQHRLRNSENISRKFESIY